MLQNLGINHHGCKKHEYQCFTTKVFKCEPLSQVNLIKINHINLSNTLGPKVKLNILTAQLLLEGHQWGKLENFLETFFLEKNRSLSKT